MRLKNKVAIVTGVDAGSIGQATALLFAEAGARIVVIGVGEQAAFETVALIKKAGGDALLLNLDIANAVQAKQACEDSVRAFGTLDILVNAVFVPSGSEAAVENWQGSRKVNVIGGTQLISRYAGEAMKRQAQGAIVNVATISGLVSGQSTGYGAIQPALLQITRDMAMELAPDNIRVNCVCHGAVRNVTSLEDIGPSDQTAKESLPVEGQKHLLNRTGTPREVAYAILFLASDEASFITGTQLVVDGGHYDTVKSSFQQHSSSRVASFS